MFQLSDSVKKIIELSGDLKEKINQWLEWDKNPKTWKEIVDLVEKKDFSRLDKLLNKYLSFGTAGIRGLMEPGFNSMNELVIIQTSQGLAKYLDANLGLQEKTVVIGFDGRHNSYIFAKLTAKVFLFSGFKVYLFSKIVPTPFVAFSTKKLAASAGVMITASHNPKQYNGYKVFASNGAQILSPQDIEIQNCILENLKPWNDDIWNISNLTYNNHLFDPLNFVLEQYYNELENSATQLELVKKCDLKITYTALHGVGHEYLTRVFQKFGFNNYFPVLSQKDPDPEFPTVVYPNPEEGKGVFDESKKTAQQFGCSLIFSNDPDSDRFCMAENYKNEWRIFNGNEIGALLGWWLWFQFHSSSNAKNINKSDCYMISSAVSSRILETFSKKEGFNFIETLTGFKWMGNIAYDLKKEGKTVLFCFEEAIGFMVGTIVYDKDGISATAAMLQLAAYLRSKNLTFTECLERIYKSYGFHYSINSYYICYEPDKIMEIFERIPNIEGPNQYITKINTIKVTRIRDLLHGYDSSTKDKKATLPKTLMVTFFCENGSVITFRASGTEPKIKYYSEIVADPESDRDIIKKNHQQIVDAAIQAILQPGYNKLIKN